MTQWLQFGLYVTENSVSPIQRPVVAVWEIIAVFSLTNVILLCGHKAQLRALKRVVHTNVALHCLSYSICHHFYTHETSGTVRMGRTLTLDLGWNLAALLMKIHICSVYSFRPKYFGRLNIFFKCLGMQTKCAVLSAFVPEKVMQKEWSLKLPCCLPLFFIETFGQFSQDFLRARAAGGYSGLVLFSRRANM